MPEKRTISTTKKLMFFTYQNHWAIPPKRETVHLFTLPETRYEFQGRVLPGAVSVTAARFNRHCLWCPKRRALAVSSQEEVAPEMDRVGHEKNTVRNMDLDSLNLLQRLWKWPFHFVSMLQCTIFSLWHIQIPWIDNLWLLCGISKCSNLFQHMFGMRGNWESWHLFDHDYRHAKFPTNH